MKIKILAALLFIASTIGVNAQESTPSWMRNSKISPDGTQVCFTYKGDIYIAPVNGGVAKQLTTNPAYDTKPFWSPSGKEIMFSSDRLGSQDIFIVNSKGGAPKRVTTHSGNEIPVGFKDENTIYYQASLMPSIKDSQFPSSIFSQIYEISVNGGRSKMFSSMPMESISITKNGDKIVYQDKKGYEDAFRKHHQSPICRDIWVADLSSNGVTNYVKLTDFKGEDRDPLFSSNDKEIFYTNEQDGTLNVYKMELATKKSEQLTFYKENPVRSLSVSSNNILSYSWNGELYTLDANNKGAKPEKINVSVIKDELEKEKIKREYNYGAGQMSLSPNGKEIAFILRGDVYVTSVEYSTTKQITNSPTQERNVDFSPDGRSLVYASERDGLWQIYESSIVRKEDKNFTYAVEIKEERLTNSNIASFLPKYSPDGKEVAFLEDRTELRVINLKSKKVRTIRDRKFEYSYADGDQWFEWSPDSKWILSGYIGDGGWNNSDVSLIKADGSKEEIYNLTQSGYSDGSAKWVLDGKAMLWFSDRAGYRSHGSWGAQTDAYIMFFDLEAYEKFRMSKEELALYAEREKGKKDDKKESKDSAKVKKVKELELDIVNAKDRVIRLTPNSSSLIDAILTKDGEKIYYITRFEGGYELWMHNNKTRSTQLVLKNIGAGELQVNKAGNEAFMCSGGQIKKINIVSNRVSSIPFNAEFTYRPKEEREYMFNHIWQQVKDKFYLEDLHNVDWDYYKDNYSSKLDDINNNTDFAELLSELLGELNASHTGARHYASNSASSVAELGIFIDDSYTGNGLKIAEIIKGSPLNIIKTDVKEGYIIEKIDGVLITPNMDYFPLLAGKVGKHTLLTVKKSKSGKSFEQEIKPISSGTLSALLYKRWVERRAAIVDSLSNGKLGYIHIKGMDSPSFREMYSTLLGKLRGKEAVIVDTRHNGGGWLHDDVVTLLSGKKYQDFVAHGQYIGSDPFNKWNKPSCMLICEDNYSNAHGTPWIYQELGIGKLIGSPVAGTMTAVWWETLIDPSIVFGIPQVGCVDVKGNYAENNTLHPDILVYNTPEETLNGQDLQLEAAIKYMLEVVAKQ